MRSKVFSALLLLGIAGTAFGQNRLAGTVASAEDSTAIRECIIYLDDATHQAVSDGRGKFVFPDVPNGEHMLHFTQPDYEYAQIPVALPLGNKTVRVFLSPRVKTLEEVVITDARTTFGFTRLRSVENSGIYEGKKTEVIVPDQLIANTATNNARQVYSRVAGLNIWENDDAGLQLSVGGRGLDPSRSSNFNVRQNGYDISADALGYPESYYTPPVEGVGKIEIVRGAASLQYGTQFGGLINFRMKTPVTDKKVELVARQTAGSNGFYNAFTSASGTVDRLGYYTFFQYKRGDGWRPHSGFNNHTFYGNLTYAVSEKSKLGLDITQMGYLAQQPGGLTDDMFNENPRQSNRDRNWFAVDWNLLAAHFDHKFSASSEFNLRLFGLYAHRYSLGFRPNRVATVDDHGERDLIKGDFRNWGAEARYLKRYSLAQIPSVVLVGSRFYMGSNHSTQGAGSAGEGADFDYMQSDQAITYDYRFPNRNVSFFAENIFFLNDKFSITPGVRFEHINTTAEGFYGTLYKDLAGNVIDFTKVDESRTNGRHFLLAGVGFSYKPGYFTELYSNFSQNYRSITFNDMRISNPSSVIDPDLKDETGYSIDLGIRSDQTTQISYDVSLFYLNYDNRIGEVQFYDDFNRVLRMRTNIGQAIISGVEAYGEADILGLAFPHQDDWTGVLFTNIALIRSVYRQSDTPGVKGNQVEFVPGTNLKTGVRVGYRNMKVSFQDSFLSRQFTDATNSTEGGVAAVTGIIPSYNVMDISLSYERRPWRLEGSINNVANRMYFTRRATGYPGPGILPSDGRSFFLTLQVKVGK